MVLGVAGKICSGKNYVCSFFQDLGYKVVDLDLVSHDVLYLCKDDLVKAFGPQILQDNELVRSEIAKAAFRNEESSRLLDSITHPIIMDEVRRIIRENKGNDLIVNGALLNRCGIDRLCDDLVLVWSPWLVRLLRSRKRTGLTRRQFILRSQQQKDIKASSFKPQDRVFILCNLFGNKFISRQVQRICARIKRCKEGI